MKSVQILMAAGILTLAACTSAPDADKAKTEDKQAAAAGTGATYNIDTTTSTVAWVGAKPAGQHTGTFALSSGSLTAENGTLTSGSFVININSMNVTDLQGEDKGKLEGHLKSGDFFDVEKFATAKFEVTGVTAYDSTKATSVLPGATHIVSGNLTLKDSTKNVTFPAIITVDDAGITAKADFNIDRTTWGMNYKGPNNPQDWLINKEVNLKLDIKGTKK